MEHFVLIKKYGFSEVFLSQILQENHLEPARVLSQEKGFYRIITDKGEKVGRGVRKVPISSCSFFRLSGCWRLCTGKLEQIRQQLAYRACPKCRETEDNGMIQEPLPVAAVVHGGTIMALLSHYCGGDYFSYQVKNAEGYHLRLSLQENKMELKEKV